MVAFWAESTFGDKIAERWFIGLLNMFLRLRQGVITGQCLVAGKDRTAGVLEVTCFLWNAIVILLVCLTSESDKRSQLSPDMVEHFVLFLKKQASNTPAKHLPHNQGYLSSPFRLLNRDPPLSAQAWSLRYICTHVATSVREGCNVRTPLKETSCIKWR